MKRLLFVFLLCMPFVYSCKVKEITYSHNGKTIHLGVNQQLKIKLPGDASSRNNWRKMEYNDSIIIRKGKGNYMLGDGDPMMGESGVYYYKFLAVNPGTTKLKMEYGHKYKYERPAEKVFEIEVVVGQ